MQLSHARHPIDETGIKILCAAVTLLAFLAAIRGIIIDVVPPSGSVLRAILKLLLASFYEFLFVAGLTAAFLAALWMRRIGRRTGRAMVVTYFVLLILTIIVALINMEHVRVLGGPFPYQWFTPQAF